MQVKINGKPEEISGGTVLDLLQAKKIEPQSVEAHLRICVHYRRPLAPLEVWLLIARPCG